MSWPLPRFAPLALLVACNGGDTDPDTDSDSDPDPADEIVFRAYDDAACAESDTVVRGEATLEDDHWAATRFSPGALNLTRVAVVLLHDPSDVDLDCNAGLEREVQVWLTDGGAPPATPNPDRTLTIAEESVGSTVRVAELAIDPPLEVGANQDVYVSVQMRATSTAATCVRTCTAGVDSDDNFWSNAADTPYSWTSYSDLPGLDGIGMLMWIAGTEAAR